VLLRRSAAHPYTRTASPIARNVRRQASPVVPPVQARVVGRTVDPDPVGLVDAAAVPAGWAGRKRAGDLDPPVLLPRDLSYLVRHLREILILAQNQPDVVRPAVGQAGDVERDADVDPFLLSRQEGVSRAVGQ